MHKAPTHRLSSALLELHIGYLVKAVGQAALKITALGLVSMTISSGSAAQTLAATPESFQTPEFEANWGLGAIGAQYAYSLGFTGAGIKLGIADTPYQFTHPEFAGRIYYPTEFPPFPVSGFPVPEHGTHVMGTAAAARNNEGMMGVAFDATLAGIVSLDSEGYPEAGDWAGELIAAGVSVMNGSFGPDALPPKYFDRERTQLNPNFREMGFKLCLRRVLNTI